MTFNKLQDIIYSFFSQNKIIKNFIDISDYISYAFVILYFISKLVSFNLLVNASLYYLFFILFITLAIGKKYISIIILTVNNIICSLNELLINLLNFRYTSSYSYVISSSYWKIIISILINFFVCFLVLSVLKKNNNEN